ncbi:hypothetical protein BJ878DRAFT_573283 [Calycina marina]|uniref:Uncharacterized protein n=1 Tax=Calycina marina TaxID=1763456 RepID=A0A9P7Z890_9HELO|nr:hypothetical protein BJ878DRAFT_573283 [Calycina marina]
MQFFKSIFTISALLALSVSALSVERSASFAHASSECEKEDAADCQEFCELSQLTATCAAKGNKITCYCKGGKSGESNCEERCLFCMPDKALFEEAKSIVKAAGRVEL